MAEAAEVAVVAEGAEGAVVAEGAEGAARPLAAISSPSFRSRSVCRTGLFFSPLE